MTRSVYDKNAGYVGYVWSNTAGVFYFVPCTPITQGPFPSADEAAAALKSLFERNVKPKQKE